MDKIDQEHIRDSFAGRDPMLRLLGLPGKLTLMQSITMAASHMYPTQ